jgi:hypothetical protein
MLAFSNDENGFDLAVVASGNVRPPAVADILQ